MSLGNSDIIIKSSRTWEFTPFPTRLGLKIFLRLPLESRTQLTVQYSTDVSPFCVPMLFVGFHFLLWGCFQLSFPVNP